MTPQEASRAAFEAWDKQRWEIDPELYARFRGHGDYKDWPVRCRWETWQAATAARDSEIQALRDALEEIALAGMSGSGQESEEGVRDWHARRAWEFIGIAARALNPKEPK